MKGKIVYRFIAFLLSILICFCMCSCTNNSGAGGIVINPNGEIITQEIIHEDTIVEDTIVEDTIKEVYLRELVICEEKIEEQLLQETTIEQVFLCQSYYISQENIGEFTKSSQISTLFAEDINLKSVFTKISIGTGVIVTLVALKIANIDGIVGSIFLF